MLYLRARLRSLKCEAIATLVGTMFHGTDIHAHRPHRTHPVLSTLRISSWVSTVMPLVPLVTGVFGLVKANPIMGPPAMIRASRLVQPAAVVDQSTHGNPDGHQQIFRLDNPSTGDADDPMGQGNAAHQPPGPRM